MTSRFPFPAYRPPGKRKRETSLLTTLPPKVQQNPFASAEDRATLGSDPSADWSPANGRSGGFSYEGRPASPLPVQGKKRQIHLPSTSRHCTHNWHRQHDSILTDCDIYLLRTIRRNVILDPLSTQAPPFPQFSRRYRHQLPRFLSSSTARRYDAP